MPADICRIMPARSISRWLTIWASGGVSLSVGRKYWDRRMGRRFKSSAPRPPATAERGKFVLEVVGQRLAVEGQAVPLNRDRADIGLGLAAWRQTVLVRVGARAAQRLQFLGDV